MDKGKIMDKSYKFYKTFYDNNRVSILQYNSLRKHFDKMVNSILGKDYYNTSMDVYECDRMCCEDITSKKKSLNYLISVIKE